jgi:hypothetical protein
MCRVEAIALFKQLQRLLHVVWLLGEPLSWPTSVFQAGGDTPSRRRLPRSHDAFDDHESDQKVPHVDSPTEGSTALDHLTTPQLRHYFFPDSLRKTLVLLSKFGRVRSNSS